MRKQVQYNIAQLLGIDQMYLSSWELNQKVPHPKYIDILIKLV
ncbi:hypothetical protein V1T75_09170 [Tenacibaculum sp. FZY0031]|nr:hypothetical protein [Tenacibaculum sp. FZY0031]